MTADKTFLTPPPRRLSSLEPIAIGPSGPFGRTNTLGAMAYYVVGF